MFADNTAGDISAQDIRDLLVSMTGAYGELYVTSTAATQVIGTSPTIVTAWDTVGENDGAVVIPSHSNNNMRVTQGGVYCLQFDMSFVGSNSTTYTMQPYIDGVVHHTKVIRKTNSSGDIGTYHTTGIATLVADQVVDIRVSADGAGKDYTVYAGQFSLRRMG
jgi:hypothetical protein